MFLKKIYGCIHVFLRIVLILFIFIFPNPLFSVEQWTLSDASLEVKGESEGDKTGETLFNLGNVNGLGGDDFFLGASFKRNESLAKDLAGEFYIISSANLEEDTFDLADASSSIPHTDTSAYFSRIGAGNGDLDGDGKSDFVVVNIKNTPKELNVYLGKDFPSWDLEGSYSFLISDINIISQEDSLPRQISLSGDVNGDGFDDLLVGADVNLSGINENGRAMLVLGRDDFFSSTPNVNLGSSDLVDVTFVGDSSDEGVGYNVAIIPDINGDGYDDILISAFDYNLTKGYKVYLVYGRSDFSAQLSGGSFDLSNADAVFFSKDDGNDAFGESISGLGDIDSDGYGDFAIAAPRDDNSKGAIYIYYGGETYPFTSKTEGVRSWSAKIVGETYFYYLGLHSLTGIGDINGDLLGDIAIGEYWNSNKKGKVYVVYGESEKTLTGNLLISDVSDLVISGGVEGDQVGYIVDSGGDIDQDGVSELLIGANRVDSNKGAGYVFQKFKNVTPNSITSITLYSDSDFSTVSSPSEFSNRDWVYVDAVASDQDGASQNIMELAVTSTSFARETSVRLRETTVNSGKFRGKFQLVRSRSSFLSAQISGELADTVTMTPKFDKGNPNKTLTVVNAVPILSDSSFLQVGTDNSTEVRITYTATDYDNDLINFIQDNYDSDMKKGDQIQYSSDGEHWFNAKISGSVSDLGASENGTVHDVSFQGIVWDVVNDIGVTDNYFFIRMRPYDGTQYGSYLVSSQFHIDNVAPDAPQLSTLSSTYANEITVTGSAEGDTTVFIYVNNEFEASANVDSEGLFEVFPVTVTPDALITAIVEDDIGFRSPISNVVTVNFSSSVQAFSSGEMGVTVSIPLNAVTNNRTINFSSISVSSISEEAPSLFGYIDSFSLEVDDGVDTTVFSEPVTVQVQLSQEMPVDLGVSVNYLDTETSTWKSDGITLIDVSVDSVTFTTTHFTQFAVLQLVDPYFPVITSVRLDGALVVDHVYVDATPTLSAEIQDSDSGISTWSITIQKQDSLSVVDSTEAGGLNSTSNLLIAFNPESTLDDAAYKATFLAIDKSGNKRSRILLFNVNSSSLFFDILNAPNPFNPDIEMVKFGFSLSKPVDSFDIHILSLRRDRVWRYRGNSTDRQAGYHTVVWDGKRDDGRDLPNGVYYAYCIVKSGNTTKKKRLKIAILR